VNSVPVIREIKQTEHSRLPDFLYEAIFIPVGTERPGRDILNIPEISRYISDFGRSTDLCLVAEINGELTGAIWVRIFPHNAKGFGYVDEETPELSMSVLPGYRGKGIGTCMLSTMLERLKCLAYKQVSLSVDLDNYAFRMYKKFGFETVEIREGSATMVKILK
jgi:ribosomal protein S18 acetylase RimI-like enzyme